MIVFLFFCTICPLTNAFLIENQIPGKQANTENQFLTNSEFIDEKTKLQNSIMDLRLDMDRKFTVLASQLQQMFSSIRPHNPESDNQNKTIEDIEKKFHELMENNIKLKEKLDLLEQNCSKLNGRILKNEQKTFVQGHEIIDLKSLKSVLQLGNLSILQDQVQKLTTQTHSILVNEQARTGDFRALYNLSAQKDSQIEGMVKHQNVTFASVIKDMRVQQDATINDMYNNITYAFETMLQKSKSELQRQLTFESQRVAVTSCMSADTTAIMSISDGQVIKFTEVMTNYGISNLSSYRSSGKFTCEIEGLYIFTSSIYGSSGSSYFGAYHNGREITRTVVTYHNIQTDAYSSGTTVAAVQLQPGDTIWVKSLHAFYTNPYYNCQTIVRIK